MSSLDLARMNFRSASDVYIAAAARRDYASTVELFAASQRAWFVYSALLKQVADLAVA